MMTVDEAERGVAERRAAYDAVQAVRPVHGMDSPELMTSWVDWDRALRAAAGAYWDAVRDLQAAQALAREAERYAARPPAPSPPPPVWSAWERAFAWSVPWRSGLTPRERAYVAACAVRYADVLPPRTRLIVAAFLVGDSSTTRRLATEYGVTPSRVRQVWENAMLKLRNAREEDRENSYRRNRTSARYLAACVGAFHVQHVTINRDRSVALALGNSA
jgi:hypothetical protein